MKEDFFVEQLSLNEKVVDLLEDKNLSPCGFKANVYYKKDSKEIIISYQGSKEIEDFSEDRNMFFGYDTQQAEYAKIVYDKIKNENPSANIALTGHLYIYYIYNTTKFNYKRQK